MKKAETQEFVIFLTEFALLSYNYSCYSLIGYCQVPDYQFMLDT